MPRARPIPLPLESRLAPQFASAHLADAYAIALPVGTDTDIAVLARAVMASPPKLLAPLMGLRDAVMAPFGVKTSREIRRAASRRPMGAVGSFAVEAITAEEVVMGERDRHLDFTTSFLIRAGAEGRELVWISAVRCNNALGRLYLAVVAPFHRRLVPAFLDRAARRGWPASNGAEPPPP